MCLKTSEEQVKECKECFIKNSILRNKNANIIVLRFIADFLYVGMSKETAESRAKFLYDTFMNGYCLYFAHMLKTAFGRGEVCWAAPFGHFIWLDGKVPYDCEGVYAGESDTFIPEKYLGEAVNDFRHVPEVTFDATEQQIAEIMMRYEEDCNGNIS